MFALELNFRCGNRTVKQAYHVICRDCAVEHKQCAKCLKKEGEVEIIPPEPTQEEQIKLKIEMDQLIKTLSERKRRTFLRYMEKGKKKDKKRKNKQENEIEDSGTEDTPPQEPEARVAHTREELLQKIEKLKLSSKENDGDDLYEGLEDSDSEDYDSEDNFSDDE